MQVQLCGISHQAEATIEHARIHCVDFFGGTTQSIITPDWGYLTPHDVHHNPAEERTAERAAVLARAHTEQTERFTRDAPKPPLLPKELRTNRLATIHVTERPSLILTSDKRYGDQGETSNDPVLPSAILERLLRCATAINIIGQSYRFEEKRKTEVVRGSPLRAAETRES